MTEPVSTEGDAPTPVAQAPASPSAVAGLWERIKHRKMVHWLAAYAAAAYTLLHGVEMISGGLAWPHLVVSLTTALVLLGAPVAAIIAWYHGERGLQRVSGMELAIFTVLAIIAGSVLWSMTRNGGEPAATGTSGVAGVATQAAPTVSSATAAAPQAVTASAPRTAVAVLPFSNLTGDASKEYLGDGMAEAMINTLTKVRGLKVPARTSTFAYKGRNADIRQIAKDLGVGTILEGSVQAAGKRIRITAQLINAQDGLHLWSETYDEEFTDIFKLQDKLATEISKALQPNLRGSTAIVVAQTQPTQDVEAYNLFLQGVSLVSRGSEQNAARAIDYFQQALARDPSFAPAYAMIAEAQMGWANIARPFEHYAAAERAARQALALDPSLANAHNALAGISGTRGQMLEMEAHGRAAVSLAADDGFTHTIRAVNLARTGHLSQVLEEAQKGYALAPANPIVVAYLAYFQSLVGRDEEALRFAGSATDLAYPKESSPLPSVYAQAAFRAKRYSEAAAIIGRSLDASDPEQARTAEVVRLTYAALADPSQRSTAIAARTRLYPKPSVATDSATTTGVVFCIESGYSYALMGALDVAYELVNQCLDHMAPGAVIAMGGRSNLWIPELRPFRQDVRFLAFMTRMGFAEFWQQYGPPDDCELKNNKLTCH